MSNEVEETIEKASNQDEERTSQDDSCDTYFYRSSIMKFLSDFDIVIVLVKSTVGTGLFAMPYAFAQVGIVLGIVLVIVIGFLITSCLQLFLGIHRTTCTRLGRSTGMYDEIVETTLKYMSTNVPEVFIDFTTGFTNFILIFYYVLLASICVDFIGDVIREILKYEEINNPARYTTLFLPFFMMLNLTKHLRDMSLKAMAGNILILNVVIISFICAFDSNSSGTWTVLNNEYLMYPRFIGIVFYSLSSPGLVLAIKHNMNTNVGDTRFSKLLNRGMIFIIFSHVIVGTVGYLKWGSNVSENFIRDIQRDSNGYTLLGLIILALAIYLTYGLQCYVPISIFLKQYAVPGIEYGACKGTLYLWELIVRFSVTLVSCVLPMFIPRLRLRVALLGLTCNIILTILLPLSLKMFLIIQDFHLTSKWKWEVVTGFFCIILISLLSLFCFFIDLTLIFKSY